MLTDRRWLLPCVGGNPPGVLLAREDLEAMLLLVMSGTAAGLCVLLRASQVQRFLSFRRWDEMPASRDQEVEAA